MKATLCLSLVAFGQLCAVAMAQEQPVPVISPSSVGSATYITHVTVIDTENGKKIQDRTVVISGDRISEVGEQQRNQATDGRKGGGRQRQVFDSGAVGHARACGFCGATG